VAELYQISTLYGLQTVLALAAEVPRHGERLLVVSIHTVEAEATSALIDHCRASPKVRAAFDRVIHLNELLWPVHPAQWTAPRGIADQLLIGRMLRSVLGVEKINRIFVESLHVPPTLTLATLFREATIDVYADGLMAYGPTRTSIDHLIGPRIRALHYPDLCGGLRPLLFEEFGTPVRALPVERLGDVLGIGTEVAAEPFEYPDWTGKVLFVGQYLSGLGLMSPSDEADLYALGLRQACAEAGTNKAVFRPHPSANPALTGLLIRHHDVASLSVEVDRSVGLLEDGIARSRPALVAGVFSTGLFTAHALFGVQVRSFGTEQVYHCLSPFENSNRIPVVLAHYILGEGRCFTSDGTDLSALYYRLRLVSSAMHPGRAVTDPDALSKLLATAPSAADTIAMDAHQRIARMRIEPPADAVLRARIAACINRLPAALARPGRLALDVLPLEVSVRVGRALRRRGIAD
jgi:hypothetical protein